MPAPAVQGGPGGLGCCWLKQGLHPASPPLAREQGRLGWVQKALWPQAGPPGTVVLSPRAEGLAGGAAGAAGTVGGQAHIAHPWRHETQAWPTSHLLPTARGWHTPGSRGLAAMPPAITWPQEAAAPGCPLGHKPRPAWPCFPAGHHGRGAGSWRVGLWWPRCLQWLVPELSALFGRSSPAARSSHMARPAWVESSTQVARGQPRGQEPQRAGARREGRDVGAGPGTLRPCACAGVSTCLRGWVVPDESLVKNDPGRGGGCRRGD